MKTVCIVVGHSAQDGGAYNAQLGINEYDYNHPLASSLAVKLHRRNIRPIIVYRNTYTGLPYDINQTDADYCIDLHCNAVSDSSVQGQEVLYWHKSKRGKALAQRLQQVIYGLFNERNRGAKPRQIGDDGWPLLKETNMPAIILEPFFISNSESLSKGIVLREELANQLANAFSQHIKEELHAENI